MAAREPPRVLVIGGGSAGLLTAQALQMQGAHVTVFEQDSAIDARPRDWDFGIYWAQVPLHECLPEDLQNEVPDAQVDDHRAGPDELMPIYNALTEEPMIKLPIPYNIRLGRRKLLRLITKGLDVKYSKKLKEVSSDGKTATATFEDDTSETGDLIVGAEGAHSVVREYLVGSQKAALSGLPIASTFCIAQLPAEAVQKWQKYCNRLMVMFHPNGYFCWCGKHDAGGDSKPGEWKFMIAQSWKPEDPNYDPKSLKGEAVLADFKRRAQEYGPNFSEILQSIPEGTQCWHSMMTDWVPDGQWDNHNGTITLVGDAAHAMTFHRGQGLNNAIHDSASLARSVKEHGFTAAAVTAYEEEMIPRGREAVLGSRGNTMAVHDWKSLLESPLFKVGLKAK